jgi:hypothetical protein
MGKVRGEPGAYVPYTEVAQRLSSSAYGATDLVDLGLFYSDHFVREAIHNGKLKFQKINKRALILCKEDILEYWIKYRNEPYEAVNNNLVIKLTISEMDYISSLIMQGKKRSDRDFSKDDLFRNVIQQMKKEGTTADSQPHLFKKFN